MIPIAVQLWSLRDAAKKDFPAVLSALAEIGYVGVQPAGMHALTTAEFRRITDDLGLQIAGAHGPSARRTNIAQVVDDARALGIRQVWTGYPREDFKDEDSIRRTAAEVNECVESLGTHGLELFVHNHWWEFERLPDGQLKYELFARLCPDVKLEIDVYWAANFGAEKPEQWVARYKDRVTFLHVKDGPLERDKAHVACGAGKMNLRASIEAADENVLLWNVVELDSCDTDMLTAVRDSYRYLVGQGLARGNRPV